MNLTSLKQKLKNFNADFDPVKLQPTHPFAEPNGNSKGAKSKSNSGTTAHEGTQKEGGESGVGGGNGGGKEGMSEEQRRQVKICLRENRDLNRWGGDPGGAI